jgi:hypothetical protein
VRIASDVAANRGDLLAYDVRVLQFRSHASVCNGRPRSELAAQPFPCPVVMILAHPTNANANRAVGVVHETSWRCDCRRYALIARFDSANLRRSPCNTCALRFPRRNSAANWGSPISPMPSRKSQAMERTFNKHWKRFIHRDQTAHDNCGSYLWAAWAASH